MLYSETELKKRLKSGCPVFYFYASDEALVRSAAAKAEKFLSEEAPDTTTLDGPTPSVEDIVLAAGTISFFGGRRLVMLPLIRPSAYSDKDLQELCDTLSDTENAVFVLTSLLEEKYGKIKPGKREQKLIAACEKLGYCVQIAKPGRAALQEMARTWAGEYHTTFAPGAEAALLDRCGDDQFLLQNEIAKLAALSGYTTITTQMIQQLGTVTLDADTFDMVKLVAAGNTRQALAKLQTLLDCRPLSAQPDRRKPAHPAKAGPGFERQPPGCPAADAKSHLRTFAGKEPCMNQNKLNLTQALVVEGKYDAARLANLVDATILTTDGFAIFKDKTMQALFKRIAAAQGMILLTDSDAAGFKIRHYITGLVGAQNVLQAYIPAVPGKEPRKPEPGKEGLLGVEGVDDALILQGLHTALAAAPLQAQQQNTDPITYTDLYEWGLSGSANASERRRTFLRILGLPPRLSKKEIIQVLNTLYTRDALQAQLEAMK